LIIDLCCSENSAERAGFMDGQSGSFDIGPTGKTGIYNITLTTMAKTDGESIYKLLIDGRLAGQFALCKTARSLLYSKTVAFLQTIPPAICHREYNKGP
jgi:hypothetical protein